MESYEELKRSNIAKREELLRAQEVLSRHDYVPSETPIEESTTQSANVRLKFKSGNKADPIVLSVDPHDSFTIIIDKVKEALSVTGTIKLLFDGDPIKETDTPGEMGLEDDDLIEVRIL